MRTALEITDAFRAVSPDDPVRYDFALSRLGIRKDADPEEFINSCRGPRGARTERRRTHGRARQARG